MMLKVANLCCVLQRGMWAMIACSIALVIWSAGLSYLVRRNRRRIEAEAEATAVDVYNETKLAKEETEG